jgi:hypothetical protein
LDEIKTAKVAAEAEYPKDFFFKLEEKGNKAGRKTKAKGEKKRGGYEAVGFSTGGRAMTQLRVLASPRLEICSCLVLSKHELSSLRNVALFVFMVKNVVGSKTKKILI